MDIGRILPPDIYDALVGANSPSAGNVFITAADLDGNGIYDGSGSLTSDTVVTQGAFDLFFEVDTPGTGKLGFGRSGETPASAIHFFAPDAGGIIFEGFNSSPSPTVQFTNYTRTLTSGEFQNNGDVLLALETGITSRARVVIGNNGTPWTSNAKLNIRGGGSTNTTWTIDARGASGALGFSLRGDNVAFFGTQLPNQNSGVVTYGIAGLHTTTTNDIHAGINYTLINNPTANGNGRPYGAYIRALKQGNFNQIQMVGIAGEAFNLGEGDFTNASLPFAGVLAQARNTGLNTTIQNMFGLDANVQSQAGVGNEATIVNMGGIRVRLDQTQDTNVTNMYGIWINDPVNTVGANVTTTYGIRVEGNTLGTANNYGIYYSGSSIQHWLHGDLSIGNGILSGVPLAVQANGNTDVGTMVSFESLNGTDRAVWKDNGQSAQAAGTTAAVQPTFGHYSQSLGYTIGHGFYGRTGTNVAVFVVNAASDANGIALDAQFQGSPTGTATTIRGLSWIATSTSNIGVSGSARSGSLINVGVEGLNGGGQTQAPSAYNVAVRGLSTPNLSADSFGGRFEANWNNGTIAYNDDFIGLQASAAGAAGLGGSTGNLIAANLFVGTNNGAGSAMALRVPSTGNIGTVVLNADAPSANGSFVELHDGNFEIINSNNGVILESPDNTRWLIQVDNSGSLTFTSLP